MSEPVLGTKDGDDAADNDQVYRFGLPVELYVSMHDKARLVLLRARLGDRHLLRDRRGDLPSPKE